jgi:hypothetical protein
MQILNLQDGIVKSSLVQQVQERAADLVRSDQAARVNFHQELARQAEEVIAETPQAEHEAIREEEERGEGQGQRRRSRHQADQAESSEEQKPSSPPSLSPHRIDIVV